MLNLCRINCVLAKQNFHNQTSKLFSNNADTNFIRNYKIAKLSSSNGSVSNHLCGFRFTEAAVPLSQSLFSFYSDNKSFISSRNFSKSSILWSGMPSNQNKEKLENYMFFGTVVISVIFVIYMLNTMEYHQDYVHIEPSEKKK